MKQEVVRQLNLEMLTVPVDHIHANPWNPNRMDDRTYQAERESLREFGFIDPVLVRPHPGREGEWEIIDGEHRLRAATDEGFTEAPITPLRGLSDAQAKRLTVILNETRGEADVALLGRLLAEIRDDVGEDELRIGLPYSRAEIDHLLSVGAVDWDDFGEQPAPPPRENSSPAEVVLGMSKAQLKQYQTFQRMLGHEWELDDETQVVLRAMKQAAEAL